MRLYYQRQSARSPEASCAFISIRQSKDGGVAENRQFSSFFPFLLLLLPNATTVFDATLALCGDRRVLSVRMVENPMYAKLAASRHSRLPAARNG